MQHPQRQRHHLQIFTAGRGGDVAGFGAHVVDDGFLQPGDQEVGALVDDGLLDARQAVENDGAGTAFDVVEGELSDEEGDGGWGGPPTGSPQDLLGHGG